MNPNVNSGTGKSHLLIPLGAAAAENRSRVRCTLVTKLTREHFEAADEKNPSRRIAREGWIDLLMIDDLGYMDHDRCSADPLFHVLVKREETNCIAVASSDSFYRWPKMFTYRRLCAAIVDQLTFDGTIIEAGIDSFRQAPAQDIKAALMAGASSPVRE